MTDISLKYTLTHTHIFMLCFYLSSTFLFRYITCAAFRLTLYWFCDLRQIIHIWVFLWYNNENVKVYTHLLTPSLINYKIYFSRIS